MRICRLQEVDLTPLELPGRTICSALSIRLHATNNPLVSDEVSWTIALITGCSLSDCQSRNGKGLKQVLNHHGGWSLTNEDGDRIINLYSDAWDRPPREARR